MGNATDMGVLATGLDPVNFGLLGSNTGVSDMGVLDTGLNPVLAGNVCMGNSALDQGNVESSGAGVGYIGAANTRGVLARNFYDQTPQGVDYDSVFGHTGTIVTYYRKRARDSGAPGTTYVFWVTTDPDGPYGGVPPHGGPLVDTVILEVYQQ
jgi:hypothetical protein